MIDDILRQDTNFFHLHLKSKFFLFIFCTSQNIIFAT